MDGFDQEIRKRKEEISSLETAQHTLTGSVKRLREEAAQAERLAAKRLRSLLNEVQAAKAELDDQKAAMQGTRVEVVEARRVMAQTQEALKGMAAREVEHRQVSERAEAARAFLKEAAAEIATKENELGQLRHEIQLKSDAVRELRDAEGEWLEEMRQGREALAQREEQLKQGEAELAAQRNVPAAEWEELREARFRLEEDQLEAIVSRRVLEGRERAVADSAAEVQQLRMTLEEEAVRQGEWRDALLTKANELERRIGAQAAMVEAARQAEADARKELADVGRREAVMRSQQELLDKQHQEQQALERELNERVEIIRRSSKALTARERQVADQTGA
jgi:chromosome segregation ATPase